MKILENLLMTVFGLTLLPVCLTVFGLPLAWIGGEGIDASEIYTAYVSLPLFTGACLGLSAIERHEKRQEQKLRRFLRECEKEYERGFREAT